MLDGSVKLLLDVTSSSYERAQKRLEELQAENAQLRFGSGSGSGLSQPLPSVNERPRTSSPGPVCGCLTWDIHN